MRGCEVKSGFTSRHVHGRTQPPDRACRARKGVFIEKPMRLRQLGPNAVQVFAKRKRSCLGLERFLMRVLWDA
jgi:hypothetical protein